MEHHHQQLQVVRSVEEMQQIPRNQQQQQQQELAPPKQPQKCPRCDSDNTKFCYYNNYSVSQPRYFCKSCRRYWTHGGNLRNIPVGGSRRKGKRARASEAGKPRSKPPPPSPAPATAKSPIDIGNNHDQEIEEAMGIPPMSSYYPGNGFLSTLADIQILNTYNQTTPDLLQDFTSHGVPSFGLLNAQPEQDSHQLENRDKSGTEYYSIMYPNSRSAPVGSWNQTPTMNNLTCATTKNNSTASIDPVLWSGDLHGFGLEM